MGDTNELIVRREDGRTLLCSPGVGRFTRAVARGRVLTPGSDAGVLECLGASAQLRVPHGVSGRVVSDPPELVRAPVGHGEVLYELAAVEAGGEVGAEQASEAESGNPVLRARLAGRFWHRPAPGEAVFVEAGDAVENGQPVGLLEVMKTFNRVHYRAVDDLPARARVVRHLVGDGDEVEEGEGLLEVEPA